MLIIHLLLLHIMNIFASEKLKTCSKLSYTGFITIMAKDCMNVGCSEKPRSSPAFVFHFYLFNFMTALFFDIKRFAVHDGPGIRTTFFMQGCPLSCWWCHNPESRAAKPQESSRFRTFTLSIDELLTEAEKDSIFFEESGGGITFSGGEPTAQLHFLIKAAQLLKQKGFHVTLDTAGFFPAENAKEMAQLFNLILFDIKHLNSDFHKKYTGVDNQLILENLDRLVRYKANVRLRVPFIAQINGMRGNLEQLAAMATKYRLPVDLLPYHRIAGHKYEKLDLENKMKTYSEPSENKITEAKIFLEKQNIQVSVGG